MSVFGMGLAVAPLALITACAGVPGVLATCPITVVQTHDVPDAAARTQEYEVVEWPYRIEMSSRDQHKGQPLAIFSIFGEGWGEGVLRHSYAGPAGETPEAHTDAIVLTEGGLTYQLTSPGPHEIRLESDGSACAATIPVEIAVDAGTWQPGDALTYDEFPWP